MAVFRGKTAPQFRGQIKADLSYFEQKMGLISQAVSIRAIVEIDQAQWDRQRQQDEADIALGLTYFII